MGLKHQIQLKHKLLIAILLTYIFLVALGMMSYRDLDYQIQKSRNLQENILIQDKLLKIKEYITTDISMVSEFANCTNEQDLDNSWNEHLTLISNINSILDTICSYNTKQTDEIMDFKKQLKLSVVEKQKSLYREKIRQLVQNGNSFRNDASNEGLIQEIITNITYLKDKKLSKLEGNIKSELSSTAMDSLNYGEKHKLYLILIIVGGAFIYVGFMLLFIKLVFRSFDKLKHTINKLNNGDISTTNRQYSDDEIGQLATTIENFLNKLQELSENIEEVGDSKFDREYKIISDKDKLGIAFTKMKKNLQVANIEAQKMKEQEDLQNWATNGIAKFGDILRQPTKNNEELSYNIIKALIEYIDANQGGLFIVNDDATTPKLELMATYAYGRKKFREKEIQFGEGLVGTCAIEAQTIHMINIPEDYIEIESYLGHANPKALLLVPLKLEKKLFGVIELASFKDFEPHEIKFIEDLAETIASTLSNAKINAKTAELLEISKQQSETMLAQEEIMRQNLEELQSTQEEASRREKILQKELSQANNEIAQLKEELSNLQNI